jgi:hypothetical protein
MNATWLKHSGEPTLCIRNELAILQFSKDVLHLTGDIGGSTTFSWEGHHHSLDLLPPGHSLPVHESSTVVESREPFLPGQATESVLKVTKRPKLRAKDVAAHRQSLTGADAPVGLGATRFWNLDSSFGSADVHADHTAPPSASYFHIPHTVPTPTVAKTERAGLKRSPASRGNLGLGSRWPSPTSTTAPGGPESGVSAPCGVDDGTTMATLMFGSRGINVSVSPGMPVRELRSVAAHLADLDIQLFWNNTFMNPDGDLSDFLPWHSSRNDIIDVRVVQLVEEPAARCTHFTSKIGCELLRRRLRNFSRHSCLRGWEHFDAADLADCHCPSLAASDLHYLTAASRYDLPCLLWDGFGAWATVIRLSCHHILDSDLRNLRSLSRPPISTLACSPGETRLRFLRHPRQRHPPRHPVHSLAPSLLLVFPVVDLLRSHLKALHTRPLLYEEASMTNCVRRLNVPSCLGMLDI